MQISGVGFGMDTEAIRQKMFSRFDADGSGGLSLDEFTEAHDNRPAKPGSVEGARSVDEIFSEIDTNGDGELTEEELLAHRQNNPSRGAPGGMMSSEMFASLQQMLEGADTDSDGSLNEDEFMDLHGALEANRPDGLTDSRSAEDIFTEIDTDDDGELSAAELEQYRLDNPPRHLNHLVGMDGFSTLLAAQEAG